MAFLDFGRAWVRGVSVLPCLFCLYGAETVLTADFVLLLQFSVSGQGIGPKRATYFVLEKRFFSSGEHTLDFLYMLFVGGGHVESADPTTSSRLIATPSVGDLFTSTSAWSRLRPLQTPNP